MIRTFWLEKTEKIFDITQAVGTAVLLVSAALLKTTPDKFEGWGFLQHLIQFNQEYGFLLIIGLTILVGIVSFLKKRLGTLNTWKTITSLLEKYKKAILNSKSEMLGDPEFHHRITLFKYVGTRMTLCKFPWHGWMIPVARAGHTGKSRKIPRFRVFADNPDKAEGVAGQAFVQKKVLPVCDLPEITNQSSDEDIRNYAKQGFVTEAWIRKRETCVIRSMLGIPIEVKGMPWGVMVIDSRRPDKIISEDALLEAQFTTLAEVVGKLLET